MSIDQKGTSPGLTTGAKVEEKVHNMRCKNERCDSMEAIEIKIDAPSHHGQRVYRCVKCSQPVSLNVGGSINI